MSGSGPLVSNKIKKNIVKCQKQERFKHEYETSSLKSVQKYSVWSDWIFREQFYYTHDQVFKSIYLYTVI